MSNSCAVEPRKPDPKEIPPRVKPPDATESDRLVGKSDGANRAAP
jgi:hypothetical protein